MKITSFILPALVGVGVFLGLRFWKNPKDPTATTDSPSVPPAAVGGAPNTRDAAFWEVKWTAGSTGLQGKKNPKSFYVAPAFRYSPQLQIDGTIRRNSTTYEKASWFPPAGFTIAYNGQKQGSIKGDPRALYCLALLIKNAGLTQLDHLGMYVWQGGLGDVSHDYGYAIDITGGKTGNERLTRDQTMNALIAAADDLDMPIAWISSYKKPGTKIWPLFQLRGGTKVEVSYSKQDHTSHYHLILPRPNWAAAFTEN